MMIYLLDKRQIVFWGGENLIFLSYLYDKLFRNGGKYVMNKISFKRILRKRIFIFLAIVIFLVLIIVYINVNKENNKVYKNYKQESLIEIDSDISRNYEAFAGGVLAYTTDGISFYKDGREVFNKAISIIAPIISVSDEYVVIAEKKSSEINLIDKKGNQSVIASTYPVIDIDVSDNGIVAASLDDGNANYIEFYDKTGAKLVSGRTVLEGDGYPIALSIADDSTRLAASYLAISGGKAQSKVVFYNYTSVGENEVDRIVGGFNQYTDTIVPEIEFINDTTVVAIGDNMFSIYSIKQKPKLVYEETYEEKIESVFFSSDYIGIVFINNESEYSQVLRVYNTEGKKVFSKTLDFKYNDIAFVGKNVVMYDESSCKMYSFTGKERFSHTFEKKINKLVPITENKYIIVTNDTIEELKLD